MSATAQIVLDPVVKPIENFVPTTFLERGVCVPFTTPQLNGARARPGERAGLELIIPNPSGGHGVYILPWGSQHHFCTLTVNDRQLMDAISKRTGLTPEIIRDVAREVAGTGLAGRNAMAAAAQAKQSNTQARLQANFDLLIELVRQTEPKGEVTISPERDHPDELERRGRRALARIAPRLGRTSDGVALAMEQLADVFQGVGVRHESRVQKELANVIRLRQEATKIANTTSDERTTNARLVASAAELTEMLVSATLADIRAIAGDIKGLLRIWCSDPAQVAQLLARPDWLLDGWQRICAIWAAATEPEQVLAELATLVPIIPREADSWASHRAGHLVDLPRYRAKVVQQLEDWRTGSTVTDLVARNEQILGQVL
jgi:hypothetical protein